MSARPLLALLALLAAGGCRGGSSPPPDLRLQAPSSFRLLATESGPSVARLRWQPPLAGPVPVGYWLYLSSQAIDDGNKARASRFDVPVRLIAPFDPAPEFTLYLYPDKGKTHVAVETRRKDGSVGPLSENVEIDTTQRIAWIEEDSDGTQTLQARTLLINHQAFAETIGAAPAEYAWSPFGTRLAYVKDTRLHTVIFVGGGQPGLSVLRTSEALPPEVGAFRYAADGATVAFLGKRRDVPEPLRLFVDREPFGLADRASHTFDQVAVHDFAWDEEQRAVAYLADGPDADSRALHLALLPAGGPRPAVLDPILNTQRGPGHKVLSASWSPKATWLAFVAHDPLRGDHGLFLVRNEVPHTDSELVRGDIGGTDLQWSSDGRSLAYRIRLPGEATRDLWLIDVSSKATTRINDALPPGGSVTSFALAPVGGAIAFAAHDDRSNASELFLTNGVGRGARKVGRPLLPGESVAALAWSLDGERLAYRIHDAGAGADELAIVDRDGVAVTAVADFSVREASLAWSTDGALVTFIGAERGTSPTPRLFALEAATGIVHRLTNNGDRRVVDYSLSRIGWRTAPAMGAAHVDVVPPK